MIELDKSLRALSEYRPVFHSEADFQHALAWQIQREHPDLGIRLEYRAPRVIGRMHIDTWLRCGAMHCPIELAYKTRAVQHIVNGEEFNLSIHAAQDLARYDFWKDVSRIEQLVRADSAPVGFAVLLTNDAGYWSDSGRANRIDASFRLHDGAMTTTPLAWNSQAGEGTTRGREAPISLAGSYAARWEDYSSLGGINGRFRLLIVAVRPI